MANWPPANNENYLIPPHPPLEKGGWGNLKVTFHASLILRTLKVFPN